MDYTTLSKKLLEKSANSSVSSSEWPSSLYFPSSVSEKLKSISNYTNKNADSSKVGPSGWEYELSVLYMVDTLYLFKPQHGDYQQVNSRHSFNFAPEYKNNNKELRFKLKMDDVSVVTKYYKTTDIQKQLLYGITASFHTHPKYYHRPDLYQYTFFSMRDIYTLVNGSAFIMGVVMGNDVFLAGKTSVSQPIPSELLHQASRMELESGIDGLKKYISESLKNYGIIFYHGKIGGRFYKI